MRSREKELLIVYLLVDVFLLLFSLNIVHFFSTEKFNSGFLSLSHYILLTSSSWVFTYFVFSKKNIYLRDGFSNRTKRISFRVAVYLVVLVLFSILAGYQQFSTKLLAEQTVLFYVLELGVYFCVYKFLASRRKRGLNTIHTAIVGKGQAGEIVKNIILNNPDLGYKFEGFLDYPMEVDIHSNGGAMNLGIPGDVQNIFLKHSIQEIIVALPFKQHKHISNLVNVADKNGIRVKYLPEEFNNLKEYKNGRTVSALPLINAREIPLDEFTNRWLKRIFDIFVSLVAILFIFSWLFPIIAIIIKFQSKGPVFFTQERTGIFNRTFLCYKFRSMRVNNDANSKQATKGDSRITPIGRFMRKNNIDELPQFFNVLLGDMSVVGPRPHMLKHTEQYTEIVEHYMLRHYVKPGITGWAQVNGLRGETDENWKMEERVKFDREYIEKWNFLLDIKIVWLTIFGKGVRMNAF